MAEPSSEISTKARLAPDVRDEGGLVDEFREPINSAALHKAKTTSRLAILSFVALFLLFITHFMTVLALVWNKADAVDQINRVFNIWVPIFAGYFGSAVTFYFTQDRK
jgi:hypothetical protein